MNPLLVVSAAFTPGVASRRNCVLTSSMENGKREFPQRPATLLGPSNPFSSIKDTGSASGSESRAVRRPSKSVTVVKGMADVVHRDVHQEHTDAGGEEDLESPREVDADYLVVGIGQRLYRCCSW